MMLLEFLAVMALILAAIPAGLSLMNLVLYRRAPPMTLPEEGAVRPGVSVLIPARDEELSIRVAVERALDSRGVDLEVVVMDDGSRDRTAAIVREIAIRDPRVRLVAAPSLPAGWCGKQHACQRAADVARHSYLTFIDADVELAPDALERLCAVLDHRRLDLVSGVPRQRTGSAMERLVVPLIHFVLLGFLPMMGMRWSSRPAFAAGCGQLFMTRCDAYGAMGGHGAIRDSRHDGLRLPRAFREAGLQTDLVDATDLAACRMYRSAGDVWNGFAKNADEGMASTTAIVPWTLLLLGGQVLPALLVLGLLFERMIGGVGMPDGKVLAAASVACILGWGTRGVLTVRFRQSWLGAVFHPVGIALVVAIQWWSLAVRLRGRAVAWKGRVPLAVEPDG